MTLGGWVMLIASWAAILGLNVFCFLRLFAQKPAKSMPEEEPSGCR